MFVVVTLVGTVMVLFSEVIYVSFLHAHFSKESVELQDGVANCQMLLDTQQSHLLVAPEH